MPLTPEGSADCGNKDNLPLHDLVNAIRDTTPKTMRAQNTSAASSDVQLVDVGMHSVVVVSEAPTGSTLTSEQVMQKSKLQKHMPTCVPHEFSS